MTVADPDLWGHLRFGQDIWTSGDVAHTDPYSYLTAGQAWINHEWLAELSFFWVYNHLGASGLISLKVLLCIAILAAIFNALLHYGFSYARASIVTIWVTLLILPGVSSIRPQIFTYLFFLLLLLILQRHRHAPAKLIWSIPIIFSFWVNIHGGFLAGMAVLLVWMAIRVVSAIMKLDRSWRKELPHIFTVLFALAALFLNPYGAGLLRFLLTPETVMRPEIMEWNSLEIFSNYGGFLLALIVFATVCVWLSTRRREPAELVILASVSAAALLSFRHGPLLGLAIPVLTGEHMADVWHRWMAYPAKQERKFTKPFIVSWAALYVCLMGAAALTHFRSIRLDSISTGEYPVEAVALLKRSGIQGNMAVFFNWGEYALWHLAPEIRVSIDGRRETVYSDTVYQENLSFSAGTSGWNTLLTKYPTTLALVSRNYPVFDRMVAEPGWVQVYADDLCGLFAKEKLSALKRLKIVASEPRNWKPMELSFP